MISSSVGFQTGGGWKIISEDLELFPIRWNRVIDKKMRRNKQVERMLRSHLIGKRSGRVGNRARSDKVASHWYHPR